MEIKLRGQLPRVDFTKEVSEIPMWFPLANHVLYTTTVRRPHLYPIWTWGTVIFHVTTERSSLIYRRARYWGTTSCPLIAGSLKKAATMWDPSFLFNTSANTESFTLCSCFSISKRKYFDQSLARYLWLASNLQPSCFSLPSTWTTCIYCPALNESFVCLALRTTDKEKRKILSTYNPRMRTIMANYIYSKM